MQFLKTINGIRRNVMRNLTRNLGVTRVSRDVDIASKYNIQRVLICRPNHRLGNLMMITPLLQEVIETLPSARIDLFTKGRIAPTLFRNYNNIDRIIQLPKRPARDPLTYLQGWIAIRRHRYDLVINVVNHSSSGRLSAHFANARLRFLGEIDPEIRLRYPDHKHMAKYPVYSFRNFIHKEGFLGKVNPARELDLKLDAIETETGRKVLHDLVKNQKRTICLYTYATGVKCYSCDWWRDFYERLKLRFQHYNIVELLPVENVSQIDFVAPSFYSKDLRLIGGFIAATAIFVGADSGMMHLASATHTPTIGLFKSEKTDTYAPYGNSSAGILTGKTSMDEMMALMDGILHPVDVALP